MRPPGMGGSRPAGDRRRPLEVVRERAERADDADGDFNRAGAAVHRRPDGAERAHAARQWLGVVARLLRDAGGRLHAGGGGAAAAIRPAPGAPGILTHRHPVLAAPRAVSYTHLTLP